MCRPVHRETVASWHSELELTMAHLKEALEGTIEINILSGPDQSFVGKITAYTTDLPNDEMLLYDSSVTVGVGNCRVIQLFRRVVAVPSCQKLVLRIFGW